MGVDGRENSGGDDADGPGPAVSREPRSPIDVTLLRQVGLTVDGRTVDLGPPKQRAVFAALAVDAGRGVPVGSLIERVWGDPPTAVRSTVYAHVARLRQVLRGVDAVPAVDIAAGSGGYTLLIDPQRTDLDRYRRWIARAGDTALDPAARAGLYGRALSLWGGEPLAGVSGEWAAKLRDLLRTRHVGVLERWADCELLRQRPDPVIDMLHPAVQENPLAESLLVVLLRALAMGGRTAEALDLYARRRRLFLDTLGTEPGRRLAEVHTAILRDEVPLAPAAPVAVPRAAAGACAEPATAGPARRVSPGSAPGRGPVRVRRPAGGPAEQDGVGPSPGPPAGNGTRIVAYPPAHPSAPVATGTRPAEHWPAAPLTSPPGNGSTAGAGARPGSESVPRQLPPDVPGFTGRDAELASLDAVLDGSADPDASRVCCVSGTAGVGKTALVVHWAHQVSGRFPDGQFFLDLRGFGPDRPVDPAEALEILLRAVRGDGFEPPPGLEARSGRFRSAVAGLRILLILDNAASAEQVRPLLPGGSGCLTIVTSRHALPALVARDGARRLDVPPLRMPAATGLLGDLLRARVEADPDSVASLARRCAGLPLMLRVAAEVALARPYTTLADLLAEVDGADGWLDLFDDLDDDHTSIRRVFSWSYRCLDPDTARVFRLLGSQPGWDIDEYAAAAMLGVGLSAARRRLRALVDVNLAVEPTRGRFGMHDLLRTYARELDADREAMRRLLEHYVSSAALAMAAIQPADTPDFKIEPVAGPVAALLADPRRAMTWLHAERRNILAAIVFADTHGFPEHAVRLAGTTRRYLELRGYHLDVAQAHHHALNSARRLGDRRVEAITHRNLGVVFGRANRNSEAEHHFRTAITLYRDTGDRAGEANCMGNLGLLLLRTSRAGEAETCLRLAIDLALELELPLCAASDLTALGTLETFLGRYEDAIEHHVRAIAGFSAVGFWQAVGAAQDGLGEAYLRLGRYDDARACLDAALASSEASGHRYGEAATLNNLGELHRVTGRPDEALTCFHRAIGIAVEIGDDRCEAAGHNGVARVLISRGLTAEAAAHLRRALASAVRAEDSQQRVRALIGAAVVAGHDDAARQALDSAAVACTPLETLERREIQLLSARLGDGHHATRG